jgi:hypothetical protein
VRIKMFLILWMLSPILLMNSCISTTQPIVEGKCPPDGYFLIKKDSLTNLMESCARTKSELAECLERERK